MRGNVRNPLDKDTAGGTMDIETLSGLTLAQLRAAYTRGTLDPVEVMEVTWAQIDRVNGAINALYDLQRSASLAAAKEASLRFRQGVSNGLLDGIPVSIKDSLPAAGMVWHHGTKIHGDGIIGTADALPTARLKAAGAIILGKTTMPDFGLSASGVSTYHGIVHNPWGMAWNTGGSSAGAGASLAAGIAMLSVGTDIAGSVRLPAGHCGLAALKPTQGTIAYVRGYVHSPGTSSSAGPIVRHAADLETHLRLLGGVHDDDLLSVPVLEPTDGFAHVTVAVYRDFDFGPNVEDAVLAVLARAEVALGQSCHRVRAGTGRYDFDAYLPMDDAFKLRAWAEYRSVPEAMRHHTPMPLLHWFSEAQHWNAERIAQVGEDIVKGNAQTAALFGDADFLLTPVMPVVNFAAQTLGPDPTMPLRHCTFTAPFNQSGHPAVVIHAGFDARGLPVGVQLVGKRFDDVRLCRLAAQLETQLWPDSRDWPLEPRA